MKKLFIVLFVSLFFSVGCSGVEKVEQRNEAIQEAENVIEETTDDEEENDKGYKEVLTEVGQKVKDDRTNATVELVAINEVGETIDLDPLKLTIHDIKILKMYDIKDSQLKNELKEITGKDEIGLIQVMYTIENTEDKNVELVFPIEYIVLNTGEQIDVMVNDMMLDYNNGGDFYGKVTKDTGISVVVGRTELEDIETVKLITGDVWEIDGDYLTGKIEKTYNVN